MNANTIVTVVLALHADGKSADEITAVLTAMGFGNGPAYVGNKPQPVTAERIEAKRNGPGNPALMPSKAYRVAAGHTAARVAAMGLPESENAIVALLLSNGPLGRRAITERLNHETKKVTESLLHKMRTRGIIESVALDAVQSATAQPSALAALIAAEQTQTATAPTVAKRKYTRKAKAAKRR